MIAEWAAAAGAATIVFGIITVLANAHTAGVVLTVAGIVVTVGSFIADLGWPRE